MTITTGAHPKALWPGVKSFFGKSYAEKHIIAEMVFDKTSSDKAYEEYVEETGFGYAPKKPEGQGVSYDTDKQGYVSRLTNVTFGLGFKVTREAIEDNQYDSVARKKAAKLARSMRQTREVVGANILNRAFDTNYVGGDASVLCTTSHATIDGTQSNTLAVQADFSEASAEDMLTSIRLAKDSRGLRIQARAVKLIVPPQLMFDAHRVLSSTNQSGTANNDINAMRDMGVFPGGVVVWDYLTDPDAWFVKTDIGDGLILQERRGYEFKQDNDFDTQNACAMATERYAMGWADWRGIWGTQGA
jgi:hypothetical protein